MRLLIEYLPGVLLLSLIAAAVSSIVFKFVRKPGAKRLPAIFAKAFVSAFYVFAACRVLFNTTKYGIYGDRDPWHGNYTPFRTILEYVNRGHFGILLTQVAGNVLVTLPLPFVVWFCQPKRKMRRVCAVSIIITALIEPVQLLINIVLGGPSNIIDIDDLILNLAGCAIGLLIVAAVNRFRKARAAG
jgi:glycopeptide antibiotics resistance protein